MSPANCSFASAIASAGSNHGGTWVSTRRPDVAQRGRTAAVGAGEVQVGWVVVAGTERRLGEQQVGSRGQLVEAGARTGVAGVGEGAAAARTRIPNAGTGCTTATASTVIGPMSTGSPWLAELELVGHPGSTGSPYAAAIRSAVPTGPQTGMRGCGPSGW